MKNAQTAIESEALALVEHLRQELRAYANPQGFGTIWQIADSKHEATEWATQYLARGARSVKIEPHADGSSACDVLIVLPRDKAAQVLGTQPGDEEWLDEPDFGAGATTAPQAEAAPAPREDVTQHDAQSKWLDDITKRLSIDA